MRQLFIDAGVIPVSTFATCAHMDKGTWCKQPVQFLLVDAEGNGWPPIGACGEHGNQIATEKLGMSVAWGEPCGFISREDPAGAE